MTRAVFVCGFARTPVGRYGGALASVRTDELAATPIRELMRQTPQLNPADIGEVILGCANQAGEDNRNIARMALLLAGLPPSVPGITVNRLCASGMDAVATGARQILAGESELIVAGGVESMSRAPFVLSKSAAAFSRAAEIYDTTIGWRFVNPRMKEMHGVDSMPETAENVARQFNISREDQDAFALRSQQRTAKAQNDGRLAREIIPVQVSRKKGATENISEDEHPRPNTTPEKLSTLRPICAADGTVTAGNSSGVNDGAAALLLASESAANQHKLNPIARVSGAASAGVEPRIMGVGPVTVVNKLCERMRIGADSFDVIELNEAFAAQALAVLRELNIPDDAEHVNPNGGAIALGHPLGMSGARITGAAALELSLRKEKRALATMCVGVGQGVAVALESP